jgi:ketosteroid isomerase-like protein
MKFHDSAQVVREFYRAGRAGELDIVRSLLAKDVVLVEPDSMPYRGSYRGAEAVMQIQVDLYTKYYEFSSFELTSVISEGENAAAHVKVGGVARATGTPIETSAVEWFVVRDGRIISIIPYHYDTAVMLKALGTK